MIDPQICFRLADTLPAVFPSGPFRLGDAAAEALSELLQVFACGARRRPVYATVNLIEICRSSSLFAVYVRYR
jgi:hypothetical protein